MARPGGDRIKELSNTSGTGSFVLAGVVSGEGVRAFSAAEDGQVIRYGAKHVTADEGESGYGVYTHATRTLTRLYRYFPTLGGSAVSFSAGGVHVVCSAISGDFLPNIASIDPTADDDITAGYLQGHIWLNTTTPSVWYCRGHDDGAADWVRVDAGAGSAASQAEAEAGAENTKFMTALRTEQHEAARQAVSSTSFNPASIQIDDNRQYDTYNQSGAVSFVKNAGGTFRRGKVVQVTFNSDGGDLTWTADFEPLALGSTLPDSLPAGLHTLVFAWNSHRSTIQVAWASSSVSGPLDNYTEVLATQTGVTGAVTLSMARPKHTITIGAANVTSVTLNDQSTAGFFRSTTVDWTQDGVGGRTVALPTNGVWAGATPTLDTAAGKTNRITYTNENGGTAIVMHYGGAW